MQNSVHAPDADYADPRRATPDLLQSRRRFHRIAGATLGVCLFLLGLWTLHGFLDALVWAAIIAIAVWPVYQATKRRCPPSFRPVALPAVFTVAVALLFILPMVLFAVQISHEAESIMSWYEGMRRTGFPTPDWLTHVPLVGSPISDWWQENLAGPSRAEALIGRLDRSEIFRFSQNVGVQLARRGVIFTFTVVTLFFLLKDGESLAQSLLLLGNRLFGPRGALIGHQIVSSIRGTVDGLVLVGLGEGLLLGISYYIAGVPRATLLGAVTAVAAIIPFGAPLIFTVASLLLIFQGSTIAAIVVFLFGMAVVGVSDHVIRPVIIGGVTRLPFLWVLLGILGGVETWGLLGLFLGPAIMATLILLWREAIAAAQPGKQHRGRAPSPHESVAAGAIGHADASARGKAAPAE